MVRLALGVLILLITHSAAHAAEPAAERMARLAAQLRCLVCQNQSIADSNAALAIDLRHQIDEQIALGRQDREIMNYMVERYGDFVLYRPPLKLTTVALWFGPALLFLAGMFSLRRVLRTQSARTGDEPLSPSEQTRARALLDGDEPNTRPE